MIPTVLVVKEGGGASLKKKSPKKAHFAIVRRVSPSHSYPFVVVVVVAVNCCRCCCCCCCCSHINSHNQVRGHRTGSSHSGAEEYPREKTQTKPKVVYTHISQLTQFMPPPEKIKSEIFSLLAAYPLLCL